MAAEIILKSSSSLQWWRSPPQCESTSAKPAWLPAPMTRLLWVHLLLTSGRSWPCSGGVAGDGQSMQQQRRFTADWQGRVVCQHDAPLCKGGVVRSRGEEVHLGCEEDLLPVRHIWPLVHHLALDHRAQCKTCLFVLWMCVRTPGSESFLGEMKLLIPV